MARRRSEQILERLKNLPVQDKGRAIVLEAAKMGKSQYDLVRIVVNVVTKVTTLQQVQEIAPVWAPLLELTPERFVELGKSVLGQAS